MAIIKSCINTEKIYGVEMGSCRGDGHPQYWTVYGKYKTIESCLEALKHLKQSGFGYSIKDKNGVFHKYYYQFRPIHIDYSHLI